MSDFERVICNAQEIPKDDLPPQWVHLIPLGSFKGRDGRAWNLNFPHRLVEHFKSKKLDLPIDFEHQTADPAVLETGSGP
ncbi:MAG: phage protease, partial [Pseudomonadota bacterium]